MIYASTEGEVLFSASLFLCSPSVADPASTMIDMPQENTRNSAASSAKVD